MRTERDFDSLIGLLYEATLEPAVWGAFVERLTQLLSALQGTLVMFDLNQPENAVVRLHGIDPAADDCLWRPPMEDLWWQRLPPVAIGECFTGSDLDNEILPSLSRQQNVHGSADAAHVLGGWFQRSAEKLGVVSVLRDRWAGDFSAADRAALQRILPHLNRAMSLHGRLNAAARKAAQYESALEALSEPIFIVGAAGHLSFCNAAARGLLGTDAGIALHGGRLLLDDVDAQRELERSLRGQAKRASAKVPYLLSRRRSAVTPLIVRVFRLADCSCGDFHSLAAGASLVIVSEGMERPTPPAALLTGFFGLTRAEALLASSLLAGKSLAAIAEGKGRSIHTLRAQLKACLARLGARSQVDLVRRLGALDR